MSEAQLELIRLREVQRISGLGRSSIYARAKDGRFPSPVDLGGRAVAWVKSEVLAWVEERIRESRGVARIIATAEQK